MIRDCRRDGPIVEKQKDVSFLARSNDTGIVCQINDPRILQDVLKCRMLKETAHRLLVARQLSDLNEEFVKIRGENIDRRKKSPGGTEFERFLEGQEPFCHRWLSRTTIVWVSTRDSAMVPRLRTIEMPPQRAVSPIKKPKRAPPAPQKIRKTPEP